jgi:hypothetical protein
VNTEQSNQPAEPVPALELSRSWNIPAETLARLSWAELCRAAGRPEFIRPDMEDRNDDS